MPGRSRETHPWPLFGLRITTPRLELRIPDDDDLVELFEAARAGIHPADEMPFGIPWTDGIQEPGAGDAVPRLPLDVARRDHPGALVAAVRRGRGRARHRLAGAHRRGVRRQPQRLERLVADASAQGRGLGVEMRAAVLHLAFAGLGALEAQTSAWIDNVASQRVSLRLGYLRDGECCWPGAGSRPGTCASASRARPGSQNHFDGIEIHGLEPCLAAARGCMNLH